MDNVLNTLNNNINNFISNIIVNEEESEDKIKNINNKKQQGGNKNNVVNDILNTWNKSIINGCFIGFLSITVLYLLYLIHRNWNDFKERISNWDNLCLWVYFVITIASILHYIVNEIIINEDTLYNNENILSI